MGDFNFCRQPSDRNKLGGDVNGMLLFNEAINNLGLIELPLKGRKFTWSNMQKDPLLERLDWFFTSAAWTQSFPSTFVAPLAKPTSDHLPCVISIGTMIPKAQVFRFENHWLHHKEFKAIVQNAWNIPVGFMDSCLKAQICNVNATIDLLDIMEEMRTLTVHEWNLRDILKNLIISLLQDQNTYWKQRGKLNGLNWGMKTQSSFTPELP